MIPLKLKMCNFMCYQDNVPPLHFDGIHTACIAGDNGNGKSALIDAMTWALWGKARAKSDDDLISLGQTEMEVEFEFAVGQHRYRIIRKRAKPRRRSRTGQTILEFQVAGSDGFKVISGDSVIHTQQKIIDVLHMDYSTFINSALLLQGRADEFTVKRPVERKQVLADILGLSFYDLLESRAKELAKGQETKIGQLESAIQDINEELAQQPTYEAELTQAQGELSRLEKITVEKEAGLKQLRQEKESLEKLRMQRNGLEEQITNTQENRERWQEQARQHQSRLQEYEQLIDQRRTIEANHARFAETKKLNDELEQEFRLSVNLERQRSQLESKIWEASQQLITEHTLTKSKITDLDAKAQEVAQLKLELQQAQAELNRLAGEEEVRQQKRQRSQELITQINSLESNIRQLEPEINEITEKLDTLLSQSEAKCPLCETKLRKDGLRLIETKYQTDKARKAISLESNQTELTQARAELARLESVTTELETRLSQEKSAAQSRVTIISQRIVEAEAANHQREETGKRLSEIEQQLAGKEFAQAEQEALCVLEGELAKLNYNPEQHERIRQQLASLEQYQAPKQKLDEADRLIDQEREFMARAKEAMAKLEQSLELNQQKAQALAKELERLPQLTSELTQAEAEYQTLVSQQREAQQRLGQAQAKLERLAELVVKKKDKEKQLSKLSKEAKVYQELAQAFGKRGVQALLIETALPEIEVEANRLLGRMTDNRMNVKIETQRETKKGDVTETLDINIADELGTRNYEMFSGGEAFRINFAIRIALSKLLARRAGAPLPILIIDEGFGTQDSFGIEKLKEAINSIRDDFNQILVITHVTELRDAFPTCIDVVKTAEGSTISIS